MNQYEKYLPQSSSEPEDSPPKKSLWDKIVTQSLSTASDRVRFMITMILVGLVLILCGDGFSHLTFRATGIALIVVGWIVVAVGFIAPIFAFMEQATK